MALTPVIFVHEYISGGGWPPGELPHGLAAEGLAMLWALLSDFRAWGAFQTVATLDDRLEDQIKKLSCGSLPADEVVWVRPGQHEAIFRSLLARSQAVLILAPETNGILSRLTEIAEAEQVPVLGSSAAAVAMAGNKAACDRLFRGAGLPTPDTCLTTFTAASQVADELGYPVVTKPLDGAGCEGVCLATNSSELDENLALLRKATGQEQILLQTYINGAHASVSLLVAQGRALPLSLNGQKIELSRPFSYSGGFIPLEHPAAKAAFAFGQAAAMAVPGLRGYVGVDLVLSQDRVWLIEINPRITTSYVGLHRILPFNLAQAIWNACRRDRLPEKISLTGQATFTKENPKTWFENWEESDARIGETL